MVETKQQSSKKQYIFSIYQGEQLDLESNAVSTNPDTAHLVCRIILKKDQDNEEASLEVIDEENLPIEIAIGVRTSKQLIYFLKNRAIPENRLHIERILAPYGIEPNDWIGKLGLTKGRTYDDDYFIKIEEMQVK